MPAFNPYLPLNEFVPDGEPHVFGDRVYVFGSHDEENGKEFCVRDYYVYSAPLDHLDQWSSPGPAFSGRQDPASTEHYHYLYAPDCVQGNDGRFYLYYCLAGDKESKVGGYEGPIGVAVCDTPDGKYEYLGHVHDASGNEKMPRISFDPAVINDDGQIRLYYGAAFPLEMMTAQFHMSAEDLMDRILPFWRSLAEDPYKAMGAMTVELEDDMLTMKSAPKEVIPTKISGTSFDGHCFFEASSIRKIGGMYYFVYSSTNMHELCLATSKKPDEGFVYRTRVVSNGDIGLDGWTLEDPAKEIDNNHGGLVKIGSQWYIFYHRHTNKTSFSRQGCAEPVTISPDGSIPQARMTSCGLNGGPLPGKGEYPAAIACVLTDHNIAHTSPAVPRREDRPYMKCGDGPMYLADLDDGTLVGYRFFDFTDNGLQTKIRLESRGAEGLFEVRTSLHGDVIGTIPVPASSNWTWSSASLPLAGSRTDVYLTFHGKGREDLRTIAFE